MQFEDVLKKRLKGMAVRILANIEHTIGADLSSVKDEEKFMLTGSDLNIIRSEILNAAGDTTRSLAQLATGDSSPVGKLSMDRGMMSAIHKAELDIVEDEPEDVPTFQVQGDFNLLHKIRNEVGAGIVYNRTYTCAGIDDVVDSLLPFLDKTLLAGIKVARGEYKGWRDAVCEMYLEDLGDE